MLKSILSGASSDLSYLMLKFILSFAIKNLTTVAIPSSGDESRRVSELRESLDLLGRVISALELTIPLSALPAFHDCSFGVKRIHV